MSGLQISLVVSAGVFVVWMLAFLFCAIIQVLWAWIDDSKVGDHWLWNKIPILTKWKYPVYNGDGDKVKGKVFGYAKDKNLDGACVWGLKEGVDYLYDWRLRANGKAVFVSLTSLLPVAAYVGYKIYPVTLSVTLLILLLHLGRFVRRLSKKFNIHRHEDGKVVAE